LLATKAVHGDHLGNIVLMIIIITIWLHVSNIPLPCLTSLFDPGFCIPPSGLHPTSRRGIAAVALRAAIRNENHLLALLPHHPPPSTRSCAVNGAAEVHG
jgi:hypothetical protein